MNLICGKVRYEGRKRNLKVGSRIKSRKLKGLATVVAQRGSEILVECDDREDGKFVVSAFNGYYAKDVKRRLRWLKLKDVESWT